MAAAPAAAGTAGPAASTGLERATELRVDTSGLWSGDTRLPLDESGDTVPALTSRLRALRAALPPDETSGGENSLEPRVASFTILEAALEADPATPFHTLASIAGSVAASGGLASLSLRSTGEPPGEGVRLSFPSAGESDAATTVGVTGTMVFAAPAGGSLLRELRGEGEPVETTLARLLAGSAAITPAPVVFTANPDIPAGAVLTVLRTLRARGVTVLYLSPGIR